VRKESTFASRGSTAIKVKLSLQVGQNGRNRFTLGIAIKSILADGKAQAEGLLYIELVE
jgi:hypothetical protein